MGTISNNEKLAATWTPTGVAEGKATPAFWLYKVTYVKKRNGTIVHFDPMKIVKAVDKARLECGINPSHDPDYDKYTETMNAIFREINESFEMNKSDTISLEAIQDIVVANLWTHYTREVADEYHSYRFKRELERNGNIITKYKKRVASDDIENSNANVDEQSFSGKEKESASDISKYVALNTGVLSKSVANAHKEMLVYQHDLEKAQYGVHNCLFPDIAHVFKNGFDARNGDVRSPGSFSCACQQFAVIIQCQSQVQFGGAGAVHFDYDLVPYVRKSYRKHMMTEIEKIYNRKHTSLKNKFKYRRNMSLIKELKKSDGLAMESELEAKLKKAFPFAYEEAMQDLEYEGLQSLEAMYHNLNTLESRQGSQVPFSSINLGKDTTPEGRLVNRWTFETSIAGIGKNHLTSIFPISIFSYKKGVNTDPGDPNYDMKQLALKSLSKRIYPNFANCDWSQAHEDPNDPDTDFALMGCRTMMGFDRHGLGYRRTGRGNNVPCTIILPQVAMKFLKSKNKDLFDNLINFGADRILGSDKREAHPHECMDIEDEFIEYFDQVLQLTEKALLERFNIIAKQSPAAGPFMYQNGTIADADKCDKTVYNAVKHNTLAIGYIGVAEMCEILFGANHANDESANAFALRVVQRINKHAAEASERNNLNFSCYATPAEGLCSTSMIALQKQYGKIPGIFDRDFLTNSHHVPVWETVSIIDKLKIEAPFTRYATGGCITYIECDSTFINNTAAVEKIIDYAFKVLDIPYLAFNFPIDTCLGCGYTDEINEDECPQCKCTEIRRLRRVTGYLSTDYKNFNKGKQAEVLARYRHSYATSIDDVNSLVTEASQKK